MLRKTTVQWWRTQHVYSPICIHTHAAKLAHLVIVFVSLSLRAELAPKKFMPTMRKAPSQHAVPHNGNRRYSLPTRARIATGGKYPRGEGR